MFEYRVTKYNPAHRNDSGAYLLDDWTSYGDIGKPFGGVILSVDEYNRVEDAYVELALAFLRESATDAPFISELQNWNGYQEPGLLLAVGARLSGTQISRICRLNLQEQIWCKLEGDAGQFIHFGYDYYMYVGVPTRCDDAMALACRLGLFVEPFTSPYHDEDDGTLKTS
jgi:hypothetical protein